MYWSSEQGRFGERQDDGVSFQPPPFTDSGLLALQFVECFQNWRSLASFTGSFEFCVDLLNS